MPITVKKKSSTSMLNSDVCTVLCSFDTLALNTSNAKLLKTDIDLQFVLEVILTKPADLMLS